MYEKLYFEKLKKELDEYGPESCGRITQFKDFINNYFYKRKYDVELDFTDAGYLHKADYNRLRKNSFTLLNRLFKDVRKVIHSKKRLDERYTELLSFFIHDPYNYQEHIEQVFREVLETKFYNVTFDQILNEYWEWFDCRVPKNSGKKMKRKSAELFDQLGEDILYEFDNEELQLKYKTKIIKIAEEHNEVDRPVLHSFNKWMNHLLDQFITRKEDFLNGQDNTIIKVYHYREEIHREDYVTKEDEELFEGSLENLLSKTSRDYSWIPEKMIKHFGYDQIVLNRRRAFKKKLADNLERFGIKKEPQDYITNRYYTRLRTELNKIFKQLEEETHFSLDKETLKEKYEEKLDPLRPDSEFLQLAENYGNLSIFESMCFFKSIKGTIESIIEEPDNQERILDSISINANECAEEFSGRLHFLTL